MVLSFLPPESLCSVAQRCFFFSHLPQTNQRLATTTPSPAKLLSGALTNVLPLVPGHVVFPLRTERCIVIALRCCRRLPVTMFGRCGVIGEVSHREPTCRIQSSGTCSALRCVSLRSDPLLRLLWPHTETKTRHGRLSCSFTRMPFLRLFFFFLKNTQCERSG